MHINTLEISETAKILLDSNLEVDQQLQGKAYP